MDQAERIAELEARLADAIREVEVQACRANAADGYVKLIEQRLAALTAALNELKAECDVSVHFCEKCGQADPLKTFDIASMIRTALAAARRA